MHIERPDSDTETTGSQNTEVNRKRTFLVSPYWLDDEELKKGEVDFLSAREEQFWEDIIEEYLSPIDENKAEKVNIFMCSRNVSQLKYLHVDNVHVRHVFLATLNDFGTPVRLHSSC